MIAPDTAPYSEEEAFRVGNYQIVDVSDSVIVGGEGDNFVEIVDGKAVMTVPMDGIDNAVDQLLCWFQESRPASQNQRQLGMQLYHLIYKLFATMILLMAE